MINGLKYTNLIHILAKHATPMKARRTVLGRVPARLSTLVIRMRSIAVLLKADAIVKPPINNIIVGENMTENMNLKQGESGIGLTTQIHILRSIRGGQFFTICRSNYPEAHQQQRDEH
jgi:hypothetical protein